MIPLYGFLEGDTLGLLVLADPDERLDALARKLQASARLRVADRSNVSVRVDGRRLDPRLRVRDAGLAALDRFDVTEDR